MLTIFIGDVRRLEKCRCPCPRWYNCTCCQTRSNISASSIKMLWRYLHSLINKKCLYKKITYEVGIAISNIKPRKDSCYWRQKEPNANYNNKSIAGTRTSHLQNTKKKSCQITFAIKDFDLRRKNLFPYTSQKQSWLEVTGNNAA